MCYAVYFREEIESGVTVVIYSLNDNLLAKSLSVIAKSPAWLVGGTAYPLEALMRWTKMQFGEGRDVGVAFSQRRVRLARHAINFSSEVSAVFLLRCVSKRENIYLVSVCLVSVCVCVCVFSPHLSPSAPLPWPLFLPHCVRVYSQEMQGSLTGGWTDAKRRGVSSEPGT